MVYKPSFVFNLLIMAKTIATKKWEIRNNIRYPQYMSPVCDLEQSIRLYRNILKMKIVWDSSHAGIEFKGAVAAKMEELSAVLNI